jgi:hypothetical protein
LNASDEDEYREAVEAIRAMGLDPDTVAPRREESADRRRALA